MSLFKQVRSKLLPAAAVSVLTAGLIAGAGLQHSERGAAKNSLTKRNQKRHLHGRRRNGRSLYERLPFGH
ncbi:hypothetical protein KQR56_17015 [Bacillus velezensis]|nr:hypothetical protein [Bacillus velezensis]